MEVSQKGDPLGHLGFMEKLGLSKRISLCLVAEFTGPQKVHFLIMKGLYRSQRLKGTLLNYEFERNFRGKKNLLGFRATRATKKENSEL